MFSQVKVIKPFSTFQINPKKKSCIDVTDGLPKLVKKIGAKAFEFNEDAYYGRVKGLWTHTNTRKDKFDCFPPQE